MEFYALEGDDLENVAIVAQAVDNQWVSRALLKQMLATRAIQGLADVEAIRTPVVRAEYIRSLITSEQVVINRAFMYNTQVIRQDYVHDGDDCNALKDLLSGGVIVPYLYGEHSPDEVDTSLLPTDPGFTKNEEAFERWKQICREVRMSCVRLSWTDADNAQKTGVMRTRFNGWIRTLDLIIDQGNFEQFVRDVGIPAVKTSAFQRRLEEVSLTSNQKGIKSREAFYREFIVAPGTDPVDGKYDPSKEFSGELKQLADLSYATNLPDALGRYALTPIDALPRTALQEIRVIHGEGGNVITSEELTQLLQREAFSRIMAIQGEGFLKSLASLTLSEVIDIRKSNEWDAYIGELQALLASPLDFSARLNGMFDRYVGLARTISSFVKEDRRRALEHWMPAVTLVINIGSAVITAVWNPFGGGVAQQLVYGVVGNVTQDALGVVARVIIGGIADKQAQAQLETSVDFMRARVTDARALWGELVGTKQGAEGVMTGGRLGTAKGTVRADEYARRFVVRSQDLYDPNVNYAEDIQLVGVAI